MKPRLRSAAKTAAMTRSCCSETISTAPATARIGCVGPAGGSKASLRDSGRIHLAGNHDLAYLLNGHDQTFCPGWTKDKQRVYEEELGGVPANAFRMAVQAGPWLLSHAGFSADLAAGHDAAGLVELAEVQFAEAVEGRSVPIFEVGRARGGKRDKGGILWLDWNAEFRPAKGINQIVGHTPCRGVVRGRFVDASGAHGGWKSASRRPGRDPRCSRSPGPDGFR